MKRFVPLVAALAFWLGAPPSQAQNIGSWTVIFSGYVGTPSPPASFPSSNAVFPGNVIKLGAEQVVSIQISDASGSGGVGVVQVWTRDCPSADTTCGWYLQAECTDPPDTGSVAERCNYIVADAREAKLVVTAYTSGTFQAGIRTRTVK